MRPGLHTIVPCLLGAMGILGRAAAQPPPGPTQPEQPPPGPTQPYVLYPYPTPQAAPLLAAPFPSPAQPPPDPPPVTPGSDQNRIADPHADRVVLLPTAYTHPARTVYISSLEIVLLQLGYAFTDRSQLTLSALPPVEGVVIFDLSLKHAVYRSDLVRVAGLFSITGVAGHFAQGAIAVGRAGGVVQFCLQASCDQSLVANLNLGLTLVPFALPGVGAILRMSQKTALLLEAQTVVPLGLLSQTAQVHGAALSGGVRLFGRQFATDLAVGVGLHPNNRAVALPFLALTWRNLQP